ncbi:thermonuclease family protein [Salarchaeum sp. JOR-1]|uniref:thermonuclease family protein n=1 Tax=Salarchaeum sp. JOR-1 TaxID=2599399 RepID=UPI0011986D3E|nr:thermonuclease family protein [Salarchaeum sp. JOR-1]QDX40346.1 twin-arginine translocation signal domain-containing protein [Salarchaeum sp. JOR-1]
MRRRAFLKTAAAGTVAAATAGHATALPQETIPPIVFDSTSALLDDSMNPGLADDHVAVWAHESATAVDEDGNGDTVPYPNSRPPLVAVDGSVVGLGAPFATDSADFSYGNDEFLLNVWGEKIGGGTVLWDEGHGQYYTLSKFSRFEEYAENNGYTVNATTSLAADLPDADAAVITSPNAFSDAELDALRSFRDSGGAVFLHHQADYGGYDKTNALNDIASALGLAFRFNDTEIVDSDHNAGAPYVVRTDQFNTVFPYFAPREGISSGPTFEVGERYTATVTNVADGDTVDVELDDGATETIRILGIDTPETAGNADAENPYEWEGLGDESDGRDPDGEYPYLSEWGANASLLAEETLAGETVEFAFDPNEGVRGPYGRLLATIHYDADDSGTRDTSWSRTMVETGHGRVYDSGYAGHDALVQAELDARADGTGVWAESDPDDSPTLANDPVESLAFPNAVPLTATGGEVPAASVVVAAHSSASRADAPLVAADPDRRVALVASTFLADDYGFLDIADDATPYGNYAFLTNLATALSERDGYLAIDGGHGQFSAAYAVSAEGAQTYQRYLEGVDRGIEGVNDYTSGVLDGASALLVTAPATALADGELDALQSFQADGGAVILLGNATAPGNATARQNSLATALDTDLAFTTGTITDADHNVNGNPAYPTTNAFPGDDSLFTAYDGTAALDRNSTTTETTTAQPTTSASGSTPGFGALTAAAGVLGGAAYALRDRLDGD